MSTVWRVARPFLGIHTADVDAASPVRNQTSDMSFDADISRAEAEAIASAAVACRAAALDMRRMSQSFDERLAMSTMFITDREYLQVMNRVGDTMQLTSEYFVSMASDLARAARLLPVPTSMNDA